MRELDSMRMNWFEPDPQYDEPDPRCDECGELLKDDADAIEDGDNRYCLACVREVAPLVYQAWLEEQGEEPPDFVPAGEVAP